MSGRPAPEGYVHQTADGRVFVKRNGEWVQMQGPASPPTGSQMTGLSGTSPVYQNEKRNAVDAPAVVIANNQLRAGQIENTIDALNQAYQLANDPEVVAALGKIGGKPYAEAVRQLNPSARRKIDALRLVAINGVLEKAKELRPASNTDIDLLMRMFGADGSMDAVNVQTGMGRILRGMADEGALLGSQQAFGQLYGDPNAIVQTPSGYMAAGSEIPYRAARGSMERVLPPELRNPGYAPRPEPAQVRPAAQPNPFEQADQRMRAAWNARFTGSPEASQRAFAQWIISPEGRRVRQQMVDGYATMSAVGGRGRGGAARSGGARIIAVEPAD